MAAAPKSLPNTKFLPLLLILINLSHSLSQSPQNIQTFYRLSPPLPILPPPSPPVPPIDQIPAAANPPQRTRAALGRAIGVTAATSIVLSGLFFLFIQRFRRKRSEENGMATRGGTDPSMHPNDSFTRVDGNIKGLIVDENGLDVLYWRNLEEGGKNGTGFMKRRDEVQEKRMVSSRERKYSNKPPTQEVPLLRGKSSTSQSPIWAEDEDQVIRKEALFSTKVSFKAMEKQGSSIQLTKHVIPKHPVPEELAPPPCIPSNNSVTPLPPSPLQMAVEKMASPTPPPLPAAKKTATPPPQMVVDKTAAPPPPPVLPNKSPAPPPAPNKRTSSTSEGASSSRKNEQVKLKPLHWDKVNLDAFEHSMVWDKINKGSFTFDSDLMEALYVTTNRKLPQRGAQSPPSSHKPVKSGQPPKIFLLNTHKSQNTSVVLKLLGVTWKEIIDALINGRGLNPDTIEKLTKIAPSNEEASQITAFNGDPTRLADAESFLYHMLRTVPSAFTRFNAMLFRSNHESEVISVKESLKSIELACNELTTHGLFLKLLEAVLKTGNRLNAGTSRGNAQAFNLAALRKLSDVKSSDGKTTLLKFVVQEVVRAEGKRCVLNKSRGGSSSQSSVVLGTQKPEQSKDYLEREYMMLGLPTVGGLSAEFSNVKKAAALDYDDLTKSIAALSEHVDVVRESVSRCGDDGGFVREMKEFLDKAELEAKVVREEGIRVTELVRKTTDYYQAGGSKDNMETSNLSLFVIVRDFLGMVDRVCIEITRNVQRSKLPASHVAGGSSFPGPLRVSRFPKSPENFTSGNAKSDTDDDLR